MNLLVSRKEKSNKKSGEGIKVPHTLVIISLIILFVSIATYIVPGGA